MLATDVRRRQLWAELNGIGEFLSSTSMQDPLTDKCRIWHGRFVRVLERSQEPLEKIETIFRKWLDAILREPLYGEPLEEAVIDPENRIVYDRWVLRYYVDSQGDDESYLSRVTPYPITPLIHYLGKRESKKADEAKQRVQEKQRSKREDRVRQAMARARERIAYETQETLLYAKRVLSLKEENIGAKLAEVAKSETVKHEEFKKWVQLLNQKEEELEMSQEELSSRVENVGTEIEVVKNDVQSLESFLAQKKEELKREANDSIWSALGTVAVCCLATYGLNGMGALEPLTRGAKITIGVPL